MERDLLWNSCNVVKGRSALLTNSIHLFWAGDSREDRSLRLINICKLKTLDVEPDQLDVFMNDAETEQKVIMKVRQGRKEGYVTLGLI
jgi:hypothetical protein